MDPDKFQMRDLKRRLTTAERHIDRLEGRVRTLKDALKAHADAYYDGDDRPHTRPVKEE